MSTSAFFSGGPMDGQMHALAWPPPTYFVPWEPRINVLRRDELEPSTVRLPVAKLEYERVWWLRVGDVDECGYELATTTIPEGGDL